MFRKRPFEALFNHLKLRAKHKHQVVYLTYEEFIEFTKSSACHYCEKALVWTEYSLNRGRSAACNLDRKDNALGYSRDNCVPCCPRCNKAKSGHFSYDEWYRMTEVLRTHV
jgi:hypothetical protein